MLHLTAQPLDLKTIAPFRLSREVISHAPNVLVQLQGDGQIGYGEAAPSEYYGETQATVLACMNAFADCLGDDPFLVEEIMGRLEQVIALHPAAKAAVNMALYDLLGKLLGVPLYSLLGLDPARMPPATFTLGIDTPEEMARQASLAHDYAMLKIKVGDADDEEHLAAVRAVSSTPIRVDANGAWTAKDAIKKIERLLPYDIALVEQPVAPRDLEGLRLVREHVPIPIIADESCVTIEDIPRLAGCVDGVNLEVMKNGGLSNMLKMIHAARAHRLRVMIGCTIESSLAITASAHLTPLVDDADLDGHLLLEHDPFAGVTVAQGRLVLPDAPGLGVRKRSDA
jgi:L-alanine-DL-glutamate epimerase-like enolase superfamily enzyme